MGSEPGVGWNTACELAKYHNIWVFTREDNRSFIEAELITSPVYNLHFVYCDLPGVGLWKNGLQAVHIHYYLWQIAVYFAAKKLHAKIGFDLVHHVTYVRHSTPSFLSLLPIPFIWGPVGGGESAPLAFWKDFDWYGKTYEILRYVTRWIGERDPFVSLTARKSVLANATTEDTAACLRKLGAQNVRIKSQVGITPEEILQLEHLGINSITPFRLVSIGRLIHWKGFHLGLRAFAKANLSDAAEYWIIGEGRERKRLQKLSNDLGIAQSVKFLSHLPRTEVLQKMEHCHALVHPSLHESGGFVCLEAMAIGLPVICLNLGGPAVQVTKKTGYKVTAHTPEQAVDDLAKAMISLSQDLNLLYSMGHASQQHAIKNFSWTAKGRQFTQLYLEACQTYYKQTEIPNGT
ncbi:MAG: glycosyltransferase family 4 protein [Pleurocapsa sp. MO_226.B13]|nr:glycosyltransferase family 4 protein [Pleurocapsa sp. MO_226.B13]